jgi:hypothetical protein
MYSQILGSGLTAFVLKAALFQDFWGPACFLSIVAKPPTVYSSTFDYSLARNNYYGLIF